MSQTRKIIVEAANAAYPIYVGRNLRADLAAEVAEIRKGGARLAVVTDSSVCQARSGLFENELSGLPVLEVPSGEPSKCLEWYAKVLDFLAAEKLDRGGVLVAVGGGVVGDLAGFAAASYLRGIRFIQVPTTLLAMVDSSVGGKTGINISAGKNLVGAFHQPIAVYADMECLETLPEREFAAGMAEVIKYGLLAEGDLFDRLAEEPLTSCRDVRLAEIVEQCCQIKADVVKADERETAKSGGRALLNLGHTFGHAIENVAGYGEYLHGEAIGVGLACAARLSQGLGFIEEADISRVEKAVELHNLPVRLRKPLPVSNLTSAMMRDKKVSAGSLRFVVMKSIGDTITQGGIDFASIEKIWREVGAS